MHMQELHCTPYKLFHFVNEKFVYNQKKKKKSSTLFNFDVRPTKWEFNEVNTKERVREKKKKKKKRENYEKKKRKIDEI